MKHTPGPWTKDLTGDGKYYIIGDGQSQWGTHVAEVYSDDTDRDEAAANSNLIQHAPELLAACEAALAAFRAKCEGQHAWPREQLEAAIAKAKGES